MPDDWERKKGLNPNNPADAIAVKNKDGYTNIEEYLNGLVDIKAVKPVSSSLAVGAGKK